MVATSSTSSAMLVALTSTVILQRLSSADAATTAGSLNADFNIGQFLTQLHNNDDTTIHAPLNNDLNDNSEADIDTSFGMFNTNVSLHDAAYIMNDTTVYHHHQQQQQQHQQYAATPILSASSLWRSQNVDVDSHLISARESKSEIEINSESEGMVLELELPKELTDLIANAQSTTTPQQEKEELESTTASESIESKLPTDGNEAAVRYYATYSENELCSSKSASKFELWEESYESLKECCEANFSWEFDSCVGTL